MTQARHTDPDFVPSLRLLIEIERYAHTDVALMFGVSRERVRQWCERYGVVHPDRGLSARGLFAVRVWDDSVNRFRPVPRRVIAAEAKREERARLLISRASKREASRKRIVEAIKKLRSELGGTPRWDDVCAELNVKTVSAIQALWCGKGGSRRGTLGEIARAAGIKMMPRGHHAHRIPRVRPAACPRHNEEWRVTPSGNHWCRSCQRERKRREANTVAA